MKKLGIASIFLISLTFIVTGCWICIFPRSILAQKTNIQDYFYNQSYKDNYINFTTSDGEILSGWFFNRGKGSPLVVCFPGNSCNAGMFTSYAENDPKRSYLMLNYRGYGSSTGHLNEKNMVSDACEALAYYSRELKTIDVSLLGFSLGTGVAIQVCAHSPEVNRLILLAPFDSMAAICGVTSPKKYFYTDFFESISYAPTITCPVHVIYSKDDTVVRPENTHCLLKTFKCPLYIHIESGSHSDIINKPSSKIHITNALESSTK